MNVSIIIVNYNVKDLVLQALKSVFQYTSPNISFEVIVVDNNSSDGSAEAISKEFPEVILVRNENNSGFPQANNVGFKLAKGEYIFMLNPDTELIEDSISTLLKYCQSHPDLALIAPKLLNTDGSHQISAWRFPTITSIFAEMYYLNFFLKKKNYQDKDLTKPFEADSFSGAALFFSSKTLEQIGPLDEHLFWIEDIDFCYRIHLAGKSMHYVPSTSIIHHSGSSAKKSYVISLSNQIFNKIKYFKKHHSPLSAQVVVIISFLHSIQKWLLFSILSPFSFTARLKRKAYAYTIPRVFNPPKGIR